MPFNPDAYLKSETPTSSFDPEKYVGKKLPTSIWKKMGAEITPAMEASNPYLSAVGKTAQELFATPFEFFNQMALDYPRRIMEEKAGVTVPEPQTAGGKVGRVAAGVIGGLKNPVLKLFGGADLLKAPLRMKALAGGVQMAAYPTQQGIFNLGEKPGQFVQGATLGAAIPIGGKALGYVAKKTIASPRALEWAARNISGITDFTKNTVQRLGTKVFKKEYYAEDYVGRVFTPNVQNYVLDQIDKLGPNWVNEAKLAKFGTRDLKTFVSMDRTTRRAFVGGIRQRLTQGGWNPNVANESAEALLANAKQEYADIINKAQKPINISNTYGKIKATLINNGWATEDAGGMLVPKTNLGAPNSTRDNLIRTWNYLRTQGQTIVSPKTKQVYKVLNNGQEFQGALYELEGMLTGDPKRDRVVMEIIDTFKNDAQSTRGGIIGLKRVSKLYSDALSLKQYAPKVSNLINPERINAKFAGINAATAAKKYQALESIRSQIPKELFDDLTAHYAARNFAPEFYPSLSGIRKLGVTEASKAYYKSFPQGMHLPAKLQAATQAIKAATVPRIKQAGAIAGEIVNEPYFSPGTKAGAQALLENRRGSVVVPAARGLKKKPSEVIRLVHFSNQDKPSLLISPKYMGTAQAGAEMQRGGPKTSSYFIEGTDYPPNHEYHFRFGGSTKYTASVPRNKLYDWNADPLGYSNLESSAAEKAMIRKGYWGYLAGNPPQVRLFRAVKGTRVAK